jgi:hypothetical protein
MVGIERQNPAKVFQMGWLMPMKIKNLMPYLVSVIQVWLRQKQTRGRRDLAIPFE